MGRKHKDFNRGDGASGEVRELKDKIKRLSSDKKKLLSELNTLREAFDKTKQFLGKKVKDIPVEELIKHSDKKLEEIESQKCECGACDFTFIQTPTSRFKLCRECKKRTNYDTQGLDSNDNNT